MDILQNLNIIEMKFSTFLYLLLFDWHPRASEGHLRSVVLQGRMLEVITKDLSFSRLAALWRDLYCVLFPKRRDQELMRNLYARLMSLASRRNLYAHRILEVQSGKDLSAGKMVRAVSLAAPRMSEDIKRVALAEVRRDLDQLEQVSSELDRLWYETYAKTLEFNRLGPEDL